MFLYSQMIQVQYKLIRIIAYPDSGQSNQKISFFPTVNSLIFEITMKKEFSIHFLLNYFQLNHEVYLQIFWMCFVKMRADEY